jgi:hypothetical protein
MKNGSVVSTCAVYLVLQLLCWVVTARWLLRGITLSKEETDWILPALFAYVSQYVLSVLLIRSGRRALISNFAKSLLALLMSAGVMFLSSLWLYRNVHRLEFQGVDYVAALVLYALTVPGQLIVVIGGPVLLAFRNNRASKQPAKHA